MRIRHAQGVRVCCLRVTADAILMAILVQALTPGAAFAQLPGYEIVRITDDSYHNSYVDINDCGQIVFIKRFGENWDLSDLYLYDNGKTFRLTADLNADISPTVSNLGTIVWASSPW